jgi:hypothetical protein
LPVRSASAQRLGLLQALAVTPDGRPLAFGANPKTGVPAPSVVEYGPTPTFWLWAWDPRATRWQALSPPLNHPASEGCGLCWNAQLATAPDHAIYLYAYHWDSAAGLFRVRLVELPVA